MKRTFLFTMLITAFTLHGQTALTDSLQKVASRLSNDTNRVNVLYDLSFEFSQLLDAKKTKIYGKQALRLSDSLHYKRGQARAYSVLAMASGLEKNFREAISYNQKALEALKEMNYTKGICATYNNIGGIYYDEKSYDEAIKQYKMALNYRDLKGNQFEYAAAYYNIGLTLYRKTSAPGINNRTSQEELLGMFNQYKQAIAYLDSAIYIQKKADDQASLHRSFLSKAATWESLAGYEEALLSYDEALSCSRKLKDEEMQNEDLDEMNRIFFRYFLYPEFIRKLL